MSRLRCNIRRPIFAAKSIGANQFNKLRDVHRAGILLNYVIAGILIILVHLFSEDILSWFITSPSTLQIAHGLLMITLWSYVIFGHDADCRERHARDWVRALAPHL